MKIGEAIYKNGYSAKDVTVDDTAMCLAVNYSGVGPHPPTTVFTVRCKPMKIQKDVRSDSRENAILDFLDLEYNEGDAYKDQLLPCPFCGSSSAPEIYHPELEADEDGEVYLDEEHWEAICNANNGGCGASCGGEFDTPEEAVKKWNTRAGGQANG